MKILFICHDRSGSNMTREMLNQHPNIYIAHALPLYEIFYTYMPMYGNLMLQQNWHSFVSDLIQLYDANPYSMSKKINIKNIAILLSEKDRNLPNILEIIFNEIKKSKINWYTKIIMSSKILSKFLTGKQIIFGLKFGGHKKSISQFINHTGFTHAIFQYRDPRDVALSTYKAGINPLEPHEFVKEWADWHKEVRNVLQEKKMPFIELKYEDVINDANKEFSKIWKFLNLKPFGDVLKFYKNKEAQRASKLCFMWENISKPIMSNNFGKYYNFWHYEYVRQLDTILGDALIDFGYNFCDKKNFLKETYPISRSLHNEEMRPTHKKQAELCNRLSNYFLSYETGNFDINLCDGKGVLNYQDIHDK